MMCRDVRRAMDELTAPDAERPYLKRFEHVKDNMYRAHFSDDFFLMCTRLLVQPVKTARPALTSSWRRAFCQLVYMQKSREACWRSIM